jgi:hydantoinase/carbamoylase family amidase
MNEEGAASMTSLSITINSKRLLERIQTLSQIGRIGETGVCRVALSKEDYEGVMLVKSWMEEIGLKAKVDDFGNLIGRWEGSRPELPVLMLGSHIDSQPYGGRFDGAIGVLGALEVVQTLMEQKITPTIPIEIIAFCDEEGSRFNKGLFGSRGITGKLEDGELERSDKNGITRRQALLEFGCDPEQFGSSRYPEGSIAAYLELHIEQGPVLEAKGSPIGIVTGISGPLWLTVEMTGVAGHTGSVPMNMRQDALVGAAKIIIALNEIASSEPGAPTVGTVGSLAVFPDSRNIIPEKVSFTVDLRDIDLNRRHRLEERLREALADAAEEHGLSCTVREDTNSEPRYCSEWIKEIMRNKASSFGIPVPELMSGPFHDALIMSYVCDYGMIFVRSRDGISHNPKEYSSIEDISVGTDLLYQTVSHLLSVSQSQWRDVHE